MLRPALIFDLAAALDEEPMKRFAFAVVFATPFIVGVGCGGAATSGDASARAGSGNGDSGGSGGSSGSSSGTSSGAVGSSGDATGGSIAQGGSSGSSAGANAYGGSSAGAGGSLPCGATTCSAGQYCIVPCCGGTAPLCFDPPDGGACPAGSTRGCVSGASYNCANAADCCEPAVCTPPPPYCGDTLPSAGCLAQGRTCRLECA